MYRNTEPHDGFGILRRWIEASPLGGAVFTSNVDGHFQKAGFDEGLLLECHGSIHHLQCQARCPSGIWSAQTVQPDVDLDHCLLRGLPPSCPHCGGLARPSILMFDAWIDPTASLKNPAIKSRLCPEAFDISIA
ncbi:Sir2 family NAD-dependent protein deacetylase [Bordetella ansorpii]|uniref:Sir2 family NAD-dependent protein deacetylase n=1 Tax=Bordetella ansorpii TaxID=288768 RepID=UPI0008254104